MNNQGLEEEKVVSRLKQARAKDIPYRKVLSSMCTTPHPISIKAHTRFLETNLGDKSLFPGTSDLEREAIRMMGELVNCPNAYGYITTGGTESNLVALWAARNLSDVKNANVIVPESAHFSFGKIADLLQLKIRKIPLDDEFKADVSKVENMIDDKTIALVGTAGTTEYGQIDPIPVLAEVARDHDLFFHVDASFGGFVIPFLENEYKFGFEVKGVDSITIDPHKMGMGTIPAGGILFRERSCLDVLTRRIPYLTSEEQYSLVGTRTGASAAAIFTVMKCLGREGYRKIVRRCIRLTKRLMEEAEEIGIRPLVEPIMNILALDLPGENIKQRLYQKGWITSTTREGALRLVVMPHISEFDLNNFMIDFKDCAVKKLTRKLRRSGVEIK